MGEHQKILVNTTFPPRRKLEECEIGETVEGVVVAVNETGTSCDIGAEGDLLLDGSSDKERRLEPGERVKVEIAGVDLDSGHVNGKLVLTPFKDLFVGQLLDATVVANDEDGTLCDI